MDRPLVTSPGMYPRAPKDLERGPAARIWHAIRIFHGRFTAVQIAEIAGTSPKMVRNSFVTLANREVPLIKRVGVTKAREVVWQLVKDTGPALPRKRKSYELRDDHADSGGDVDHVS